MSLQARSRRWRSDPACDPGAPRGRGGDRDGAGRAVSDQRSGISRHLKVLERAGLIARSRRRSLASRLEGAPLREAIDWMERYRRFWHADFDRLDERLQATKEESAHG